MAPGQNAYTRSYSYDRIGNITYKSDVGSYAYTYNNQPHAVRTAGAVSLQYDLAGNMTQKVSNGVTLGITWNADNKPTLITKNGSDYIQYTCDGMGTRVRKVNLATGFVTRYYGEVYEERGATGVIHLFANATRIASVRTDGTIQYYHGNHLGSASVITDSTGTVKETIEYLPFGSYRIRQDLDGSFPDVNYTFTDQEDDDETGFYNYRARLYDPLLGRFISADSIVPEPGNLQAFNRYGYCVNNPLVHVDPSGHFFGIDILIGMAITVLIGAATGATVAAVNRTDMGMGALTGAISGAGVYLGGIPGGALAGVINASITGNDPGQGALWGAVGAGAGILAGYGVGQLNIGNPYVQFGVSMAAGGLLSGGTSALAGGDFVQGFQNGAVGAAAGYFASMGISKILRQSPANASPQEVAEKAAIDMQVSYETPEDMYGRIELAAAKGDAHHGTRFDTSDGITFSYGGDIYGGLQKPHPLLDPITYIGLSGGLLMKGRMLYPRYQGTGKSDFIFKWPGGYKTRLDITKTHPHKWPHIHPWTKN